MENLSWGLQMTVLGMGLVFSLLALLWVLLTLVLKFDKEEEEELPESDVEVAEDAAPVAVSANAEGMAGDLVAAIALAVIRHKVQRIPADLAAAITVATIEHRNAVGPWRPQVARAFWPGTQPTRWTAAGRERARQTNNWNPWGK